MIIIRPIGLPMHQQLSTLLTWTIWSSLTVSTVDLKFTAFSKYMSFLLFISSSVVHWTWPFELHYCFFQFFCLLRYFHCEKYFHCFFLDSCCCCFWPTLSFIYHHLTNSHEKLHTGDTLSPAILEAIQSASVYVFPSPKHH